MIAWNYPFGDAVMIRNQVAQQQMQMQATIASGLDLSKANFNYLILRQKHATTPAWCPLRAFDDGRKTYIQFPPKVAVTEAPPLFVMGRNGDAQLVNYRVKGDWYIVDRLFDKAELRIGEAPQSIIGIDRGDVNN
jgi:type IV secretion system protein VirB9